MRYVQNRYFHDERLYLQTPKSKDTCPALVNNLNLFIDCNNVLRSKCRLNKCRDASYYLVNPIMLPKDSYFSRLVVVDFHLKCRHLGVNTTLNCLRNSGYWLPRGRAVVKRILDQCMVCKKLNAFPFKYPRRTDYVSDRVNFTTPFVHTGVDYTGHFFVKFGEITYKFYLLVFTCLNVRCVHLELVPSMSTADFLMAFVRFTNFYSTPESLHSDNAGTFVQASKLLNMAEVDDPLNEYLVRNSIKHVKIPVYSAWVGSAWERLIRVIKNCIYKSVGRKKLEYFQFCSLLSDVQNAVNSRPLTYRDSDPNNLEVVTPNSFLKVGLSRELNFDSIDGSEIEFPNRKKLIDTLNKRAHIFSAFKDLWVNSYLLSLRETSRDMHQIDWIDRIKVGDVVLIQSPIKLRIHWPMGRVSELLTGTDSKTRCVIE